MNEYSFLKPENTLAIINGNKIQKKEIVTLRDRLIQDRIEFRVTQKPGDATTVTKKSKGVKTLLAIGGDGTLFEVINGMDLNLQQVGLIPAGTVNSIAHFMQYKGVLDAYNKLRSGIVQDVDVITSKLFKTSGTFQQKLFLGFLSAGHLADLTCIATKCKLFPNIVRYSIATLLNTFLLPKIECCIKRDNKTAEKKIVTSFIINNGFSHFFSFVPSWTLYDGAFELEIVKRTRLVQFMYNFNRFVPLFHSRNWQTGVKSIECTFKKPQTLMGDGELFKEIIRIEIATLHKKLKLCCPGEINLTFGT